MNIKVYIGVDRVITTSILSKSDANSVIGENKKRTKQTHVPNEKNEEKENQQSILPKAKILDITPEDANPFEQYVPEVFRFPFGNVLPGDEIIVKCQYLESLDYFKKGYIVSIPLYFPPGSLIENTSWDKIVNVECKINSLTADTKVNSA